MTDLKISKVGCLIHPGLLLSAKPFSDVGHLHFEFESMSFLYACIGLPGGLSVSCIRAQPGGSHFVLNLTGSNFFLNTFHFYYDSYSLHTVTTTDVPFAQVE